MAKRIKKGKEAQMNQKEIYIKPTKRKFFSFECFDVTDAEGNKLIGDECDLIRFRVDGEEVFQIDKKPKKGIRIGGNMEIEPYVNTLEINVKSDTICEDIKKIGTELGKALKQTAEEQVNSSKEELYELLEQLQEMVFELIDREYSKSIEEHYLLMSEYDMAPNVQRANALLIKIRRVRRLFEYLDFTGQLRNEK